MALKYIYPGQKVRVNRRGDVYFDVESRPFLNKVCEVVKITKAGLIMVKNVENGGKLTYSFPRYNIDLIEEDASN